MSLSTLFNFRRKSLKLTDPTTTLKGQYLGNVSTNVAKGEKCVDRPLSLLWTNYVKTAGKQTVAMKITVDNSGLKVYTTNQGLTHYWCHRISYFRVAKSNPKLFVWIYRHVGKKLKVELRCHAILLSNVKKATSLVELLTEKVTASLQEYRREKTLKHRRRLVHEKAAAHLSHHGESPVQARTKLLATSKNYKPPSEYSLTSPTLTAISEEADCSSSEESDYNNGSPYSTLGRWTFKNKFNRSNSEQITPDVNMNQLPDDVECDPLDYADVSGFVTLPRKSRSHSNRRLQKKLLVDRLESLVMQSSDINSGNEYELSESSDDFESEPDRNEDEHDDDDSGAGSQGLSGANASPLNSRLSSVTDSTIDGKELNGVDEDDAELVGEDDLVGDLSLAALKRHSPPVAHIRSFSDGFYSFDKSSISSEGSEVSIERQKVFLHSKNHVSSESGVGEEIDSMEVLSKDESHSSNSNTASDSTSDNEVKLTNNVTSKNSLPTSSTAPLMQLPSKADFPVRSSSGTSLLSTQTAKIFYTPTSKGNVKSKQIVSPLVYAEGIHAQPLSSMLTDKDFESDCSDSSVEVIRIVTRL